ncbi:MAG: alpha/beta hydrolase [Subtercola sp.]|nr:alpha/beta hydrolase [Subtercola sp.]
MSDFFDTDAQLAGSVTGSGSPVLLLHSLALSRAMWTPEIIELFSAHHQLITVDLPGHGESPIGDSATIEDMAERVALMLENRGVSRTTVVGASMGGCVSQALAIGHPNLVVALGLVDTTSSYHDPESWATRAETARVKGFAAMAEFQGTRWFTPEFRQSQPEQFERLMKIFTQMDLDAYAVVCHAMGAVDLTARLPEITAQTAIVVGAEDRATPPGHSEILATGIAGASFTVLLHASHLGIIERPREVFAALRHIM